MGRPVPSGNDADEWRLWLVENAGAGPDYLAGQIAAAIGRNAVGTTPAEHFGEVATGISNAWPRITNRTKMKISPWIDLAAREVEFTPGAEPQIYHSVLGADYVVVLAVTPDGRIPLVRQYRPAVEGFTLEFPSGMIDPGEAAAATASRELLEECGLPAKTVQALGVNTSDAGRLSNRVHSFFVEAGSQIPDFEPEPGITTRFVTPSELIEAVRTGEFGAQANLGTLLQAVILGHFKLPD
jgi:8-oxo-dGTP pyrophosphatase MutT (NUDIX family)